MKTFTSVAQMKLAYLIAGQQVETLGYYAPGDGGGGKYLIKASEAVDNFKDHDLAGTTVAVLQNANPNNLKQYGAVHDTDQTATGTDNTGAFEAAIASDSRALSVDFAGQVGDVTLTNSLDGHNIGVIYPLAGAQTIFNLIRDPGPEDWKNLIFENLEFNLLGDSTPRTINCFNYPETPSSVEKTLAGRNVWRNVRIKWADIGIKQPTGNFGNKLEYCQLANCNYGIFAVESNTPQLMHPGMLYINGGEISGSRMAGIYMYNPIENLNGSMFHNVSIESNLGFGMYLDGHNLCPDGPILDGVHFENNNSAGLDTIDLGLGRGVETIRDLKCYNVDHIEIRKTHCPDPGFEFVNSMAHLDGCFINGSSILLADSDSTVVCDNMNLDGCSRLFGAMINSITQQRRPSGTQGITMRAWIPHRDHVVKELPGSGVGIYSETFADAAINMIGGSTVRTGKESAVGAGAQPLFNHYGRLTSAAGTNYTSGLLAVTQGKWYVYSSCLKFESDPVDALVSFENGGINVVTDLGQILWDRFSTFGAGWYSVGGVTEFDQAGGNTRFRVETQVANPVIDLGATQLIQFDTQQEAMEYFNSRAFYQANRYDYSGKVTLSAGTAAIDFSALGFDDQPDTNYNIQLTASDATNVYYDTKATTGFNVNGSATAVVNWNVNRQDV